MKTKHLDYALSLAFFLAGVAFLCLHYRQAIERQIQQQIIHSIEVPNINPHHLS